MAAAERCLLVKPRHLELHLYAAALWFLDQNLHRCLQHLQLVYGGLDAMGMACATGAISYLLLPHKHSTLQAASSFCILREALNLQHPAATEYTRICGRL